MMARHTFTYLNLTIRFVFRGYNIGIRLIDEFLAKSNVSRCVDFKETAEVIAKVFYCHLNSLTFGSINIRDLSNKELF